MYIKLKMQLQSSHQTLQNLVIVINNELAENMWTDWRKISTFIKHVTTIKQSVRSTEFVFKAILYAKKKKKKTILLFFIVFLYILCQINKSKKSKIVIFCCSIWYVAKSIRNVIVIMRATYMQNNNFSNLKRTI